MQQYRNELCERMDTLRTRIITIRDQRVNMVPPHKSISGSSYNDSMHSKMDENKQHMKWPDRNNCLAKAGRDPS